KGRGKGNLSLDATQCPNSGIACDMSAIATCAGMADQDIHKGETTMNKKHTRREFGAAARAAPLASAMPALFVWAAERKYDPGASATETKLGQTVPHSGPGSLYGVLGRVGEAYFQMLNEKGGINGRKVKFFSMD